MLILHSQLEATIKNYHSSFIMKRGFVWLMAIILYFVAQPLFGAELKLAAECTKENALFKVGEKITFQVKLEGDDGSPVSGREIQYTLKGDGGLKQYGKFISGQKPHELFCQLTRPGFVLLSVSTQAEKKILKTWAGAGVEPENIKPGTPDTPDFDAFWDTHLKVLRSCKIKADLESVNEPKARYGVKAYKVQLDNGKVRANGYLLVPPRAQKGKHPLIVTFNGATTIGANYTGKDGWSSKCSALVFNMNIQDTPVNIPKADWKKWWESEEIKDYMYRDSDQPEKYRIFKVFSRIILTLEYLKTRPEWDQKTIITQGGSLGGAQALAAAYFEPKTVLCVANAPALSDHFGGDRAQSPGWPNIFHHLRRKPNELAASRNTMRYFDMVNFARRLKCPVAMSTGFIDTICPPTTGYAVYNVIPGKKSIVNVILGTHGPSLKQGERGVFACNSNYVFDVCCKNKKGK